MGDPNYPSALRVRFLLHYSKIEGGVGVFGSVSQYLRLMERAWTILVEP